jgi:hypothetical protein
MVGQSDTLPLVKTLLFCALLLTACRDDRPPAPTAKQSAELNEMDSELNAMANNEEGPADRSASPFNTSN